MSGLCLTASKVVSFSSGSFCHVLLIDPLMGSTAKRLGSGKSWAGVTSTIQWKTPLCIRQAVMLVRELSKGTVYKVIVYHIIPVHLLPQIYSWFSMLQSETKTAIGQKGVLTANDFGVQQPCLSPSEETVRASVKSFLYSAWHGDLDG
jgi:hypothetical protein